jgi:hypothetical protein
VKRPKKTKHIVYVDLSAKAEQLLLGSAIAVANDITWVCFMPTHVKARLHKWLVDKHGRKNVTYRLLAVLIYIAVQGRLAEISQIVIDQDYTGKQPEATIKNLLLPLLRRQRAEITAGFVQFRQVKGSRADRLAKQVFDKRRRADRLISWSQVERVLEA